MVLAPAYLDLGPERGCVAAYGVYPTSESPTGQLFPPVPLNIQATLAL